VVELSVSVAKRLELDLQQRTRVESAARLRNVGEVAIPKELIEKPGPLTADEWEVIRTHPVHGQVMLERAGEALREVGAIVRASHERWDGLGYPDGLSGPSIPLAARILLCCDAFDAMTNDRPYRPAMSQEAALRELVDNAGTQFDPHIVKTFISVVRRSVFTAPLPESMRKADEAVAGAR
jgi:HD-GYP domain-containing protein (c-di-GMP phosphodiesterase class II)